MVLYKVQYCKGKYGTDLAYSAIQSPVLSDRMLLPAPSFVSVAVQESNNFQVSLTLSSYAIGSLDPIALRVCYKLSSYEPAMRRPVLAYRMLLQCAM